MPENLSGVPATPPAANSTDLTASTASPPRHTSADHTSPKPLANGLRPALSSYPLGSPYALQAASRATECPPPPPDLREPTASHFAYGLTLPSATGSPLIAYETADAVLDVHGVEDELIEPALELVHELAIHACRFTGAGEMVHLVLRRSDGALQVVVHDTHTPHFNPRLTEQCAERRRVSLSVVRELVERRGGECGFTASHPPATGMCTWASLTRELVTPDTAHPR